MRKKNLALSTVMEIGSSRRHSANEKGYAWCRTAWTRIWDGRDVYRDFQTSGRSASNKKDAKVFQVTETQREMLSAITDKPTITMDELGAMLNLGRSSIYKNLKQLKEQGIMTRKGRKRDGKWLYWLNG